MSNEQEIIKKAIEVDFKDHVASVLLDTDDFIVIDWRNKNGSYVYYVRYILDKTRGSLIVQGDLGYAMAVWGNRLNPANVAEWLKCQFGYFSEKIACSTDKYIFDEDDIKADLKEAFENIDWDFHEGIDINCDAKNDKEEIEKLMIDARYNNAGFSDELIELLEKYDIDWWENPLLAHAGKRLHPRVYLWAIGFSMAYESAFGALKS